MCTPLKCRVAHPRNSLTHTHTRTRHRYIHAARVAHTCVCLSHSPLFSLTHPAYGYLSLSSSFSFSVPSSTVASCFLSLSLSPSIFYLRLTRCEHVHPSSSFVSDLKTEGRSIGRFSSGFSSATTTPRRVEKLLSGLPIRAWKKIQVDRTHSREKDDGKEEWERGWLAGVGWRERAAGGKGDGERRERARERESERARARERTWDRGKKGVPKRSMDIADLLTDLRRGNERGHGLEKGKSPRARRGAKL